MKHSLPAPYDIITRGQIDVGNTPERLHEAFIALHERVRGCPPAPSLEEVKAYYRQEKRRKAREAMKRRLEESPVEPWMQH